MPELTNPTSEADFLMQPFMEFWMEYLQQADEDTTRTLESVTDLADSKMTDVQWQEMVSESMEAYLRSPVFLMAMKHSIDTMIAAKRKMDEIQRTANCRATSAAAGLGDLAERLHNSEKAILARLSSIENRLAAIEAKLAKESESSNSGN